MFRHRTQAPDGNRIDSNNRFPFQILSAVEFEVRRRRDPRRSADDTVRNNLDRGALDAAISGRSGPSSEN